MQLLNLTCSFLTKVDFSFHAQKYLIITDISMTDGKLDIIQELLNLNQKDVCFKIFEMLDSQSFENCKLVSNYWKEFIEEDIFISKKLTSNFFNDNFSPKIDKFILQAESEVKEIIMDEKNIFVSFKSLNRKTEIINAYDSNSLQLIWRHETGRGHHEGRFTLCMNMDRVFAANIGNVSHRVDGFLYMIGNTYTRLHKFNHTSSCLLNKPP